MQRIPEVTRICASLGLNPTTISDRTSQVKDDDLTSKLWSKFERTGSLDDLQQATLWTEKAIDAFPLDSPSRQAA